MERFLIINTDGASRGNPGPAAAAFIIRDAQGKILAQDGIFLGILTNNQAEYQAVIRAFERLISGFSSLLPATVEVKADSSLLINQLSGRFKIKNPQLKKLHAYAKSLEEKVGKVSYEYIPREMNAQADALANKALDDLSR